MRIATTSVDGGHDKDAIAAACGKLIADLGGPPDLVIAYHSSCDNNVGIERLLAANFVGSALIGTTSCRGAMTDTGLHGFGHFGLGLWGISDSTGAYGTGFAELGDDPQAGARAALDMALANAGRPGETPDLVWVHATPGDEEMVLAGLDSALGGHVPIAGGSSADETIEGYWSSFTNEGQGSRVVTLAVLFPSTAMTYAFQSGYSPTQKSGIVTRAQGRVIFEIDGEAAADVYDRWSGGLIKDALPTAASVLGRTTLHPLGREVGRIGGSAGIPYYNLLHPEAVTRDRGLKLFANVVEGERLHFMSGSTEGLIARGGRVVADALQNGGLDAAQIAGGLVIFCAGCMLTVGERMPEVAAEFRRALEGRPFLGGFTFGEQGCFIGGENRHGNLMISVALFAA
jgi:hypothetical protein